MRSNGYDYDVSTLCSPYTNSIHNAWYIWNMRIMENIFQR